MDDDNANAGNANAGNGLTCFETCMTAWGGCCNVYLAGCGNCCGIFVNGWVLCYQNSGIGHRMTVCKGGIINFLVKLVQRKFLLARLVCLLASLILWITGYWLATSNYAAHCALQQGSFACGRFSTQLMKAGLFAPIVVLGCVLIVMLFKVWWNTLDAIPRLGPVLLPDNLFWNISAAICSIFISLSVIFTSPKWLGAAYTSAGVIVPAAALMEIVLTLNNRTGLTLAYVTVSMSFSAMVIADNSVEDNNMAWGAIALALGLLIFSMCMHMVIARLMIVEPQRANVVEP